MRAVDIDDAVLEASRLYRETDAKLHDRQKGEAFVGTVFNRHCKKVLVSVPVKTSEER